MAADEKKIQPGSKRAHQGRESVGAGRAGADPDRLAAYDALVKIEKAKAYSNIELNAVTGKGVHNPGFVRDLTYGVIKNRTLLDHYIGSLVPNGIKSVQTELKILLRMGIYQIVYMDSVPEHSAVDETVKIAKALFRGRSGFVNGVLRNYIRGKAADPSAIKDPVQRMHIQYSCEEGLVKLLISQYGEKVTERFLKVSLETPPLFVRVNTLKTSAAQLAEKLRSEGFTVNDKNNSVNHKNIDENSSLPADRPIDDAVCDRDVSVDSLIVSGRGVLETDSFRSGEFFVQDASSSEAIAKFDPDSGETLIDVCAAPGGKTFTAAVLMRNKGVIHAMDLHENKLRVLDKQAAILGIDIIQTEPHDAKEVYDKYRGTADKVLCDVPCSGLGVLRRKPEIKDRPLAEDCRGLAEIQLKILTSSSEYVKAGGKLMYSTCTINSIENEEVVSRFVDGHSSFKLEESKLTMPESGGSDGFYYAIMRKEEN